MGEITVVSGSDFPNKTNPLIFIIPLNPIAPTGAPRQHSIDEAAGHTELHQMLSIANLCLGAAGYIPTAGRAKSMAIPSCNLNYTRDASPKIWLEYSIRSQRWDNVTRANHHF